MVENLSTNARAAGGLGLIPGSRRSPGGGKGIPLQYSCWKIPCTEAPGGLQSMGLGRVGQHTHTAAILDGSESDAQSKPVNIGVIHLFYR